MDPKKNPGNILDRECLKPGGVETCKCEEREMRRIVKMQKVGYLGYILQGEKYEVPKLIITGKIEGKYGIDRKQHSWMRNLHQSTGINDTETIFR